MFDWLKKIIGDSYTEEIDKKISEQVGKDFVPRADFNTANETKKTLEGQIAERDKQLGELKKIDPEKLKERIAELEGENATAKTEYETKIKAAQLDYKLETRLIKEGAVNVKAVKALLDASKISLDGENLVGLDEQLAPLKEIDKWAFSAATDTTRVTTGAQHNQSGGEAAKTVQEDIKSQMYGK